MVEREANDRGVEPRVERVEHALAHRYAVVAFEHGRRIGKKYGNRVATLDAVLRQRRGEPARAFVEFGIGSAHGAMNDGGLVREYRCRAFEKTQRRQRLVVCWVAIEIDVVGRFRHWAAHSPIVTPLNSVASR